MEEFEEWFLDIAQNDPETAELIASAIDLLEEDGPTLGRPAVDRIKGSSYHNMKELRPGSTGTSEIRILFIFDPDRNGVILLGGDKEGSWKDWYKVNVPIAEHRYTKYLEDRKTH